MAQDHDEPQRPHGGSQSRKTQGRRVQSKSKRAGQPGKRQGRTRGSDDSFTGRAAQLAVMSDLLRIHCNAAIPEVDLGTDVFVFKDDRAEIVRLQVIRNRRKRVRSDTRGRRRVERGPMSGHHQRRSQRIRDRLTRACSVPSKRGRPPRPNRSSFPASRESHSRSGYR
jgi:hypothetical protein